MALDFSCVMRCPSLWLGFSCDPSALLFVVCPVPAQGGCSLLAQLHGRRYFQLMCLGLALVPAPEEAHRVTAAARLSLPSAHAADIECGAGRRIFGRSDGEKRVGSIAF